MQRRHPPDNLKTWVEIDAEAARHNYELVRGLVQPRTKLWAVVKSNAYGHGLMAFSKLVDHYGIDGFCVDSVVEGVRLRKEGISKPILVLGPTLTPLFSKAAASDLAVSVSTFDTLKTVLALKRPPRFHLKIDTGMHRQGFSLEELKGVVRLLADYKAKAAEDFVGVFTHFASADEPRDRDYTAIQHRSFLEACARFEEAGFRGLVRHCANSAGVFGSTDYHMDAVRVGLAFYGLWVSRALEDEHAGRYPLRPVLSWKAVLSELKQLQPGDCVSYNRTECVSAPTTAAVLPVGYWHGYPRALSSVGEVLLHDRRAKVLGRVCMDMMVVGVTGIGCSVGDVATLVGRDVHEAMPATLVGERGRSFNYEVVTRINPLIERVVV